MIINIFKVENLRRFICLYFYYNIFSFTHFYIAYCVIRSEAQKIETTNLKFTNQSRGIGCITAKRNTKVRYNNNITYNSVVISSFRI